MAKYYMTVKGTKQGQFKGEAIGRQLTFQPVQVRFPQTRADSAGQSSSGLAAAVRAQDMIDITDFDFPTTSPFDPGSGQPSGRRRHNPIRITKEVGGATPQIFQAFCNSEVLSQVVIGVNPGGTGAPPKETVVPRISLTGASVASVRLYGAGGISPSLSGGPNPGKPSNARPGKPETQAYTIHLTNATIVHYATTSGSLPGSRGPSGRGLITFVLNYDAIRYLPPRG
jgi:type VI protein secretion system component Hcp